MSRWESYTASTTGAPLNRQFDPFLQTRLMTSGQQNFVRSALVGQTVNTIDPSFYDCIYGLANTATTEIERCYKDIGCCQYGCCGNSSWHTKYGWAVALLVIFCILVIFAVVISLGCWLINRSKDKSQKREILEETYSQHPTPVPPTPIYSQPPPPAQPDQYSFTPPGYDQYRY